MKRFIWLSDYSKYSSFFDGSNKKVIGKMKDEFGGIIVSEFVGLKSTMYSIKQLMVKNIIQQKEWVLQLNLINLKMFYLIKKLLDIKWKEFKVKKKLGTYEIDKTSLSCFDDKKYVIDDETYTFLYFELFTQKQCHKL